MDSGQLTEDLPNRRTVNRQPKNSEQWMGPDLGDADDGRGEARWERTDQW
jgi:hypothetical protein